MVVMIYLLYAFIQAIIVCWLGKSYYDLDDLPILFPIMCLIAPLATGVIVLFLFSEIVKLMIYGFDEK